MEQLYLIQESAYLFDSIKLNVNQINRKPVYNYKSHISSIPGMLPIIKLNKYEVR